MYISQVSGERLQDHWSSGFSYSIYRPCVLFHNPIAHLSVKKKDMISLDANEALVVYKQDPKTQGVERYIKYGPTLFMPMANEWLVLSNYVSMTIWKPGPEVIKPFSCSTQLRLKFILYVRQAMFCLRVCQVVFPRVLRFSPHLPIDSSRYE